MKLIRYISFIMMITVIGTAYGQSWTGQAFEFYKAKDFENAKTAIDSAITTAERFDSQTWQLRGIIYRNISNGDELYYREIALESFVHAQKVDTTGVYSDKIQEYLNATIIRYYNDAVTLLLEQKEFEKSEESYNAYKKHIKTLLDPNYDFRSVDINYYNTMGSEYLAQVDLVESAKKNALREKSLFYCKKVLEIDSMDYKANFNAGILYYNIGVDYVLAADPFITLDELIANQKKSEDAFLKALPYLHRAEKLKPESTEVREALMGCYFGLNRDDMYLKYQTMADKENLPGYLERFNTHPTDVENIRTLIRIYSKTLIDVERATFFKEKLNELENK